MFVPVCYFNGAADNVYPSTRSAQRHQPVPYYPRTAVKARVQRDTIIQPGGQMPMRYHIYYMILMFNHLLHIRYSNLLFKFFTHHLR